MQKRVIIYTNKIKNGWSPLDKFLGGSEEAILYLVIEFFKREYEVLLFTNLTRLSDLAEKGRKEGYKDKYLSYKVDDIKVIDHEKFKNFEQCETDIFISFKNRDIWNKEIKANKKIHFSLEVEPFWKNDDIDYFVHTSNFHRSRHPWISDKKARVIPLGIKKSTLDSIRRTNKKVSKQILYCSSPDRGLFTLLLDFPKLKEKGYTLKVAYSFKLLEKMADKDPRTKKYVDNIKELLGQDGVEFLGALSEDEIITQYDKSEYWCLPLENPESELFCLNAVKSRYMGCLPIINKIGALKETVGDYYDYEYFVKGASFLKKEKSTFDAIDWFDVFEDYWKELIT